MFTLIVTPIIDNLFLKKEYERVEVMVKRGDLSERALTIYRVKKEKKPEGSERE